jgi:hypothetical protein
MNLLVSAFAVRDSFYLFLSLSILSLSVIDSLILLFIGTHIKCVSFHSLESIVQLDDG